MATSLSTKATAVARLATPSTPRPAPLSARLTGRVAPAPAPAQRAAKVSAAPAVQAAVNYEALAADMDLKSPLEIMDFALASFGPDIAIAFSGAEDVALIEYAHLTGRPYRVFSLDTGRLNPETYRLFDAVEKHYKVKIEYTFPDAQETMDFVREKGMFSFYEDGHGECCRVRKVRPLRRQLTTLKAWVTGQRKDQSPGTRAAVPVVQVDPVFEGLSGGPGSLIKFNPLSNATSAQVWGFLRVMGVPVNELHSCGYVSIGCEPCTRAVLPGQHEREGRWWWEDAAAKECGLHSGNIVDSAADQAAKEGAPDLWAGASKVGSVTKAEVEKLLSATGTRPGPATLVALYAPWCQFCKGLEPAYEELASKYAGSKAVRVVKLRADEADVRPWAEANFDLQSFPTLALIPAVGKPVKYGSDDRAVDMLDNWVGAVAGFE